MPRLILRFRRRPAARRAALAAGGACALAIPLAAVAAAPAGAATAAGTPVSYVALGDSYSSGLGAGSYISSSGSCDRSTAAYSALWASASHPASYVSVACAGATTSSVISGQLSALSSQTTLVSITVGGNDVGFESVMETCVLESTSSCVSAVSTAENQVSTILPGNMDRVLSAISAAAPNARVETMRRQIDDQGEADLQYQPASAPRIEVSTTDRTVLNQAAGLLDQAVQAAAARHGDVFGDVRGPFTSHQICDGGSSWLHSVNIFDISESYHPTAAGQSGGYEPVFAANA